MQKSICKSLQTISLLQGDADRKLQLLQMTVSSDLGNSVWLDDSGLGMKLPTPV